MASSKAPQPDFAPAWLKIPDTGEQRSSGSKQSELHHSRDPWSQYDTFDPEAYPDSHQEFRYHMLQRQRSWEYYEGARSKCSPQSFQDDYGYNAYYNQYYNTYEKEDFHHRSHPTLTKEPSREKYQHPHAYYSQAQPSNGNYNNYYDFYPYDFYPLPEPTTYTAKPSIRSHEDKAPIKEKQETKRQGAPLAKKGVFNEEFPSLNGDGEKEENERSRGMGRAGAWEKPNARVHSKPAQSVSDTGPTQDAASKDPSKMQNNSNIYKAFVPSKPLAKKSSRDALKMNGTLNPRDSPPHLKKASPGPGKVSSPVAVKPVSSSNGKPISSPVINAGVNRESRQSPTPAIEILNTRLVTQPRTIGDKKSEFLKTLKQDSQESKQECNDEQDIMVQKKDIEQTIMKDIQMLDVSDDTGILSSSLEAEQRLLKEMGWTEEGEDDYEITEDDMKEFQNRTKQVKPKQNGPLTSRTTSWNNKQLAFYENNNSTFLNDTSTSTDEDSESDME